MLEGLVLIKTLFITYYPENTLSLMQSLSELDYLPERLGCFACLNFLIVLLIGSTALFTVLESLLFAQCQESLPKQFDNYFYGIPVGFTLYQTAKLNTLLTQKPLLHFNQCLYAITYCMGLGYLHGLLYHAESPIKTMRDFAILTASSYILLNWPIYKLQHIEPYIQAGMNYLLPKDCECCFPERYAFEQRLIQSAQQGILLSQYTHKWKLDKHIGYHCAGFLGETPQIEKTFLKAYAIQDSKIQQAQNKTLAKPKVRVFGRAQI